MNSPATTAAEAPSLANLQGLLHVYKQSLDSVGSAVEQLRLTLVPFDEEELQEEDAGRFAVNCLQQIIHHDAACSAMVRIVDCVSNTPENLCICWVHTPRQPLLSPIFVQI